MILTGFFARASLVAPVEVEGSAVVVVVVLVEAVSSPASDSDSVSVRSSGHFITGAVSIKLKGSTSVPLPKKGHKECKELLGVGAGEGHSEMLECLLAKSCSLPLEFCHQSEERE